MTMASRRSLATAFFASPWAVYVAAAVLRAGLLVYGLWQDAHSAVKYTDIDYVVFTDAARALVAVDGRVGSPYARETYRYTPLLAWLLVPTAAAARDAALFSSGKALFAAADVAAGWLVARLLTDRRGEPPSRARALAAVWLLNPVVAAISTRGSAEGLLGLLAAALLAAAEARRPVAAGLLLGLAVHFKIYPFIYGPAILWWMDDGRLGLPASDAPDARDPRPIISLRRFATPARIKFTVASLAAFFGLNAVMFALYGFPFVQHTYLHHVTRLDHRHNFSPYNTLLYLASARPRPAFLPGVESVAFVPQLLLSTLLIPLVMAKKDLPASMLAQTFAFVSFNKVCTSQYFLWYMIFLPLYLPRSSLLRNQRKGLAALALWVGSQALWLQQGYELEFLGKSTFVPGLWLSSLAFFLVNCWILGIIIGDVSESDS